MIGYKLVPLEPTEEMIDAAIKDWPEGLKASPVTRENMKNEYKAMLAAAPSPPAQDGLIERLRKMAKCIHIAVDATVAADIDDGLTRAADRLAAQAGEIARLTEALEESQIVRAAIKLIEVRLRAGLAAARDENARLTTLYAAATESLAAAWDELAAAREDAGAKQAEIDRLMLEFCPDEMTSEQLAEFERNQRVATPEETAAIDAARKP